MTKHQPRQKQKSDKLTYAEVLEVVKKIEKKLEVFHNQKTPSSNERLLRYQ